MRLEPDEIEAAAERLARSSLKMSWEEIPERERKGFRQVVTNLAETLPDEKTPAALRVFMLWMGDDKP